MRDEIHHDQDAEALLNSLLGELPDVGLMTWSGEDRITSLSERCRELMQLPESAAVGRSIDLIAESPCRDFLPRYGDFRDIVEIPAIEQELKLLREGEPYWLKLSLKRCPRSCGPTSAFLLIVRDITLNRRVVKQAQQSQSFFEAALRAIPDAAVITDTEGLITQVSAGAERIFGYDQAELMGQSVKRLSPNLLRQVAPEAPSPLPASPEIQMIMSVAKGGRRFSTEVVTDWIQDDDGEVLGAIAILRDVSERLALQDELLQQTLLLDSIFRQVPFALSVIDTQRQIVQMSDSGLALFGYRQEQMANHSTRMIYASQAEFERVGRETYQATPGQPVAADLVDADGRAFQGRIRIGPLYDTGQTLKGYLVAIEDITERMAYEEELRRYEQIVSASSDALVFIDRRHIFRAANQTYLDLWQKGPADIIGAHISDVVGESFYVNFTRPSLKRCFAGESVNFDAVEVDYPSGHRFIDARHSPYRDERGEITGVVITLRDVTQRHLAERASQESQARFRQAGEFAEFAVWELDVAHRTPVDDQMLRQMLGYSEADRFDSLEQWLGLVPDPDRRHMVDSFERILTGSESVERLECRARRKDGELIHVETLIEGRVHEGDQRLVGISRNITSLVQEREELRKYEHMTLAARDGLALVDRDHVYRAVNSFYPKYHGKPVESIVGKPVSRLLGEALYLKVAKPMLDRSFAGDEPQLERWIDYPKAGRRRVEIAFTPYRDEAGEITRVLVTAHDITERHLSQIALRESEEKFRAIFDHVPIGVVILAVEDGAILDANPASLRMHGYERDEYLSLKPWEVVAGVTPENFTAEWGRVTERHRSRFESEHRRKDGSSLYVLVDASRMSLNERTVIISTLVNITQQKQLELSLRESEEKYRQIVETAHEGIWVLDAEARTTFVNPRLAEMLGYSEAEMSGQRFYAFIDDANEALARRAWKTVLQAGRNALDMRFRRKAGGDLWCHVSTSLMKGAQGRGDGIMALLTDITEQRQLTDALIRSQKMEAVGQLTGGIAHDFNNILGSILGFTELAQGRFGALDAKLEEYLGQVETAGGRARDLIRQLLIFSRGDNTGAATPIPLSPLVKEVVKMLMPMLPASIEIRPELPAEPLWVTVDPLHIQQMLMNLCINARDAIDKSGLIRIRLSKRNLSGGRCAICGEGISGDWIGLRVVDSGRGIDELLRDDIFQPFITSKQVGEGSGMGLAVVRGIVNSYNGHLLVESTPGKGACFEILLPEAEPESVMAETQVAPGDVSLRLDGCRLLVVDDETQFRAYCGEVLSASGAEVVSCHSGMQALGRYRRDGGEFDLIITDQSMPGMSGTELVHSLRKLGCRTPVIVCSGYGYEVDEEQQRRLRIVELLPKPVSRGELLKAIGRVLSR